MHPSRIFALVVVLLAMYGGSAVAQSHEDSLFAVPGGKTLKGNYKAVLYDPSHFSSADTSLKDLHRYDPAVYRNLGSIGTPAFDLFFPEEFTTGFNLGFRQWEPYRLTRQKLPFYNTQNPFSDFSYAQGQQQLQAFNALHTQNILPNWNAAVSYNMLNLFQGAYDGQRTALSNTAVNTWYRTPNARYLVMASALFNRFQAQENGGLASTQLFDSLPANARDGLPVKLNAAKQLFRDHDYILRQAFYLGPTVSRMVTDSDSVAVKILEPRFFIAHSISHFREEYSYRDSLQQQRFYKDVFISNSKTADLYWHREISNRISLGRTALTLTDTSDSTSTLLSATQGLAAELYAQYDLIKLHEETGGHYFENFYNNLSTGLDLSRRGNIAFAATARYYLQGYNAGDYKASLHVKIPFIPNRFFPRLNLEGSMQRFEPGYTDELFIANHFFWNQELEKISVRQAGAYLSDSANGRLGFRYANAANWVYYDYFAQARQASAPFHYIQVFLDRNIRLRGFHFNNSVSFQQRLQGTYIRLPQFVARASWFWQGRIPKFSKTLLLKAGIDFFYTSEYNSYYYMPEVSKFILDRRSVGNYPFFDLFVAAKVKRLQLFIKLEHINQGLTGSNYYILPAYPLYPRSLRVGLRWTFYN